MMFSSLTAAAEDPPGIESETAPYPTFGKIERLEPAVDRLIPEDAELQRLATGFDWSEGPVWLPDRGELLFSDVPTDTAYRWTPGEGVSIFLKPSGHTGPAPKTDEPGSNGLFLDAEGNLLLAQHGARQVGWLDKRFLDEAPASAANVVPLATHHDSVPFNSPNDLVVHESRDIYFTDPPYGLPDDAERTLGFYGVYRIEGEMSFEGSDDLPEYGEVNLLAKMSADNKPNGIALSPDQKTLYVNISGGELAPSILAYDVQTPPRPIDNRRVFFDGRPIQEKHPDRGGTVDGLAVDKQGNLFTSAPYGVWIISPEGELLGWIITGRRTANCAFGGPEGRTLYITADDTLCRIKTSTTGLGF
jgi:gluconolactonase